MLVKTLTTFLLCFVLTGRVFAASCEEKLKGQGYRPLTIFFTTKVLGELAPCG